VACSLLSSVAYWYVFYIRDHPCVGPFRLNEYQVTFKIAKHTHEVFIDSFSVSNGLPMATVHRPIIPSPPRYESMVKAEDLHVLNKVHPSRSIRSLSYGTVTEGEAVNVQVVNHREEQAFVCTLTIHTDLQSKLLTINIASMGSIPSHVVFTDPVEYYLAIQLIDCKIYNKLSLLSNKRRSNCPLSLWKQRDEQLIKWAMPHDIERNEASCSFRIAHPESVQFSCEKNTMNKGILRYVFFCHDRSGTVHDFLSQSIIRLQPSMNPTYEAKLSLNECTRMDEVVLAELFLGVGFLPTAERLTLKVNQLRYFYSPEKDHRLGTFHETAWCSIAIWPTFSDLNITASIFHHGHRFFQKKFTTISIERALAQMPDVYEINETVLETIPCGNISSVHVHFELIIQLVANNEQRVLCHAAFLLGEQTHYQKEWQQMLEQPRQIHRAWYPFIG
jgi:hypothetical protein